MNDETALSKAILKAITVAFPGRVVMTRTPAGVVRGVHMCRKGWPDLSGVAFGCAAFIEVKMPGKKCTQIQLAVHDELRAAGAVVFVIQSVTGALECLGAMNLTGKRK
jgi:hypothetical protein